MPTQNLAALVGGTGGTNVLPKAVSTKIWSKA